MLSTERESIDALDLKARLQQNLQEKLEGLSDRDRIHALRERAENGPLGDWWKRLDKHSPKD